jgi:hypothetical protein
MLAHLLLQNAHEFLFVLHLCQFLKAERVKFVLLLLLLLLRLQAQDQPWR